jgi:hypothetical protein
MLDHYFKILNLPSDANLESIKKAYRKIALQIHPDVNEAPDAAEKFRELCEAYEILISHKSDANGDELYDNSSEAIYNWENVIREAREKAKERARMRYAKIKADQEIFEKSEFRDLILFFKYAWSVLAIALGMWLITWPIYALIYHVPDVQYVIFFFWMGGFFLLSYIFKRRKSWFDHGHINFNFQTIKKYFDFSEFAEVKTACAYCRGRRGNGRPFKFSMLKVRDVTYHNIGPMQHKVNYNRKYKELFIPRSRKAFWVHFFMAIVKPAGIIAGMIFIPFPGIIWRFFLAFFALLLFEWIISVLLATRSKSSFLLTPFQIIKLCIWTLALISQSYVYPGFILANNDALVLLLVVMLVFLDMFLDLILRIFPFHSWFYRPVFKQLPGLSYLFTKGYQPYLDIPVWSTLYPFLRWIV